MYYHDFVKDQFMHYIKNFGSLLLVCILMKLRTIMYFEHCWQFAIFIVTKIFINLSKIKNTCSMQYICIRTSCVLYIPFTCMVILYSPGNKCAKFLKCLNLGNQITELACVSYAFKICIMLCICFRSKVSYGYRIFSDEWCYNYTDFTGTYRKFKEM